MPLSNSRERTITHFWVVDLGYVLDSFAALKAPLRELALGDADYVMLYTELQTQQLYVFIRGRSSFYSFSYTLLICLYTSVDLF
jgi:hypothetical protein